jgi:hypothetical protein
LHADPDPVFYTNADPDTDSGKILTKFSEPVPVLIFIFFRSSDLIFFFCWVDFTLLDPDPDPHSHYGSGSKSPSNEDPMWNRIRIRIRNTAVVQSKLHVYCVNAQLLELIPVINIAMDQENKIVRIRNTNLKRKETM